MTDPRQFVWDKRMLVLEEQSEEKVTSRVFTIVTEDVGSEVNYKSGVTTEALRDERDNPRAAI